MESEALGQVPKAVVKLLDNPTKEKELNDRVNVKLLKVNAKGKELNDKVNVKGKELNDRVNVKRG
jgi:hypothetical protein